MLLKSILEESNNRFLTYYQFVKSEDHKMIIFLNGATSSGKTNIAKSIQHLDSRAWLTLGIDTMINMMPSKYWAGGEKADEGFHFVPGKDEHGSIMSVQAGEFGRKVSNAVIDIASVLSEKGFDLIIDEVLIGDEVLKNYVANLSPFTVYFVGVHCERTILEEREMLRGDRFIGSGRDQMKRCHGSTRNYDIEVDTTHDSSFHCARQILDFIAKESAPKSFKT